MKNLFTLLLISVALAGNAQLTLLHQGNNLPYGICTSDGEKAWQYDLTSGLVTIYNLDFTIYHSFTLNWPAHSISFGVQQLIAPGVITNDNLFTAVISYEDTMGGQYIGSEVLVKEDGTFVIGGDSMQVEVENPYLISQNAAQVVVWNSPVGAYQLYSAVGCFPQCKSGCGDLEGIKAPAENKGTLQVYPVPTTGKVSLTYHLPPGIANGQITLYNLSGQPVNRVLVTAPFGTITDEPRVAAGTYYYQLSTSAGLTTRSLVVIK